jgi:hypothetical protein
MWFVSSAVSFQIQNQKATKATRRHTHVGLPMKPLFGERASAACGHPSVASKRRYKFLAATSFFSTMQTGWKPMQMVRNSVEAKKEDHKTTTKSNLHH